MELPSYIADGNAPCRRRESGKRRVHCGNVARFSHLANGPARGPGDTLRRTPRPEGYAELDRVRPAVRPGGAEALAAGAAAACWIGHATWVLRVAGWWRPTRSGATPSAAWCPRLARLLLPIGAYEPRWFVPARAFRLAVGEARSLISR
jgi:hypothetical protein